MRRPPFEQEVPGENSNLRNIVETTSPPLSSPPPPPPDCFSDPLAQAIWADAHIFLMMLLALRSFHDGGLVAGLAGSTISLFSNSAWKMGASFHDQS